ncbi:hypothetical protein [Candidatus Methylacidiphilum infernorum]|uniref:hypothetical protein n=1 Tax=Candidatus Methylacidiphilum infernorum TaxID=511746 RepID=UPI0003075A52|nr:hypothetical protein [Candidatus Methylacidiphilum infernorum]
MGSKWIVVPFFLFFFFCLSFKGERLWAKASKEAIKKGSSFSAPQAILINKKEFEAALPKKKKCSRGLCARVVRTCIEKLIGRPLERRDYAKEYGEVLVKTGFYREVPAHLQPRDFDVHILYPRKRSHYGHMEIFYKGRWYSDFYQPASLWQLWPKEYHRIRLYRLAYERLAPSPSPTRGKSPKVGQRFAQSSVY